MAALSFLAFGTMWFWIFLTAFVIFELVSTDNEYYGAAFFGFLVFALLMGLSNGPVFAWLIANPLIFAAIAVGYLASGIGWAFWKWRGFVLLSLERQKLLRQDFLKNNGIENATLETPVPPALAEKWKDRFSYGRSKGRPLASDNRSKIIGWMSFWPFQLLASLVRDPFIQAYKACAKSFDRMSEKIFSDESGDFQ